MGKNCYRKIQPIFIEPLQTSLKTVYLYNRVVDARHGKKATGLTVFKLKMGKSGNCRFMSNGYHQFFNNKAGIDKISHIAIVLRHCSCLHNKCCVVVGLVQLTIQLCKCMNEYY